MPVGQFVIGEGVLTWHANERHTNRYGAVFLMTDGDSLHEPTGYLPIPDDAPVGLPGRLVAEVTATRQSTHVGDWGRGLYPQTPAVGERIVLGRGRLFCQTVDRDSPHPVIEAVGLAPEDVDDRDIDWLDPRALYRAHEQTVRLVFEDAPARGEPA
jgi:hypothetical protein